ncbi:FAD-dependent oxidoreductase [Parasphingopyxis sp.]|uniref:NAD(P)/FAD-dependent oxidoreductase n=1 Tax=Parasphingopyxis sp. TaxID=1920299 RepID=UPI002619E3DD|nr:FAD-dependent oxidoreductase [Parasphingopyxis sp.]
MTFDFAIIGAGMAGASLAAELAPASRVAMLEAEDMPGYHATGRSAAFWSETYGGPAVQPLTSASHDFLAAPPPEFSDRPFLVKRGALHIARPSGARLLDHFLAEFDHSNVALEPLAGAELTAYCPGLCEDWSRAVWEPSCADIDVGGLHQAYLRAAKRAGAELRCSAAVTRIQRTGDRWRVQCGGETIDAAILINAAGAWAGDIAAMASASAIRIAPFRRTVVQVRTEAEAPQGLPLVIDVEGSFYFKGEGQGRIWLSPNDETPAPAGDAAVEEIDIAHAIDRFEKAVDWKVAAVERKWAGLRSFSPDRLPVYGFDPVAPAFFWCAGQGGFGIQTAPAAARLARSLLLGEPMPCSLDQVDPTLYAPERFA